MRRLLALGALLALARPALAAPAVCIEDALCRVAAVAKPARALVAVAGGLWAVGAKGAAWQGSGLEGESFGAAVKTGAKRDLLAATATPSGLIAVGQAGTIVRLRGSLWSVDKSPAKKDLLGVWAASDQAAWAVGKAGTTLRWDGAAWKTEASGVKVDLRAVWGSRDGDVWAVGDKSTILHHDGTGWSTVHNGATRLAGVGGTASDDVWAVGEIGAVLHWNGNAWSVERPGTTAELSVVIAYGKGDVLLLGSEGNGARLVHQTYHPLIAGEDAFRSAALAGGIVHILSDGGGLWRQAAGWQQVASPLPDVSMSSAAAHGETIALGGGEGALAVRSAGVWQTQSVAKTGTLLSLAWDGDTVVGMDSFGVVRVPGKGKPVRQTLPPKGYYQAIWFGGGIGFAVGQYGLLARWDGKTWIKQPLLGRTDLRAIAGAGPERVWAVGGGGAIMAWDGKTWTAQDSGTTEDLWSVWASGPDYAIAAGSSGAVTVWNGTAWQKVDGVTTTLVRSVCGRSPSDVLLGGNSGEILRWNGIRWMPEASPTERALLACAITPAGDAVFTEQDGGLVVRQGLK